MSVPTPIRPARRTEAVLLERWVVVLRSLEAQYRAPVRQTPAEVRAVAALLAQVGLAPPSVLPARP